MLGFAERPLAAALDDRAGAESELTFLGLVALLDPPRPDVAPAVARCRRAGIRIIVVTGDHGLTGAAIARQVGIVEGEPRIVEGPALDRMRDPELDGLLREGRELIVARRTPEAKLRIVDAVRAEGHTVAMTGDGVNDAPALRRADIGVAMGASGTDVAREAATMVLTDDDFSWIVAAVEEGRVVYENIRKFVTYIFAHATPEVVPFLVFALAGGAIPLPLSNRLLLWGIAFELAFAAAIIYAPPLQGIFHTAALGSRELAILACFPVLVWGSDELRRAALRRRGAGRT